MWNVHEYWVGWFTLSVLTAGVAQGKNRSGLNWFFISLLLGPLAVLLLVAGYDKISREEENGDEPSLKRL